MRRHNRGRIQAIRPLFIRGCRLSNLSKRARKTARRKRFNSSKLRRGREKEIRHYLDGRVTQLAFVLARDKESRPRKALPPFLAAHAPYFGEAEALSLLDRFAFAQLYL